MRIVHLVVASAWAFSACVGPEPPWAEIREDLLAMEERDQEVRQGIAVASFADTVLMREMLAVDSAHTERLREIVEAYGWPGIGDVGEDGADAAWLLLQHTSVDGGIEFHPIEDPESVDERRASVGLPPLEEYRAQSEAFYDVARLDTLDGPGSRP